MEPQPESSSTDVDIVVGRISDDKEKQAASIPSINDRILVAWDENDPHNPRNFAPVKKWLIVFIVSTGSLLVYFPLSPCVSSGPDVDHRTCTSSIYGSSYEQLRDEFHVSQEVATLGLSLFVVGLAVGPMALSPMSEVGLTPRFL